MQITGVKIKLCGRIDGENLQATASVLFDDSLVVKDVKIIRTDTKLFVAMPSRKATSRCPSCKMKNKVDAKYCNRCGHVQPPQAAGPARNLHADIAHPTTAVFRQYIETTILQAYEQEVAASKLPGYRPAMDSGFAESTASKADHEKVTL